MPNECYLWHGTKPDVAPLIVHGGFDERVCALQGLFGAGVYFAMNSSKSDQYGTPDPSGTYTIFLSRVVLGKPYMTATGRAGERRALQDLIQSSARGALSNTKNLSSTTGGTYPEYRLSFQRRSRKRGVGVPRLAVALPTRRSAASDANSIYARPTYAAGGGG